MFYISFDGNRYFQRECGELFCRFDLLDHKRTEAFEAFLASPYLVEDTRLNTLFKLLYPAYQKKAKYAQGKKLVRKICGPSVDPQQHFPKLQDSLLELSDAVYRFITYERLQEAPADYYRLMAESALARKRSELFEPAAQYWKKALEGQPASVHYITHQWLKHHYAYFRLNDSKTLPSQHDFRAATRHFNLLKQLVEVTYANEELSWKQVFGYDAAGAESEDEATTQLIKAYEDLLELRKTPAYNGEQLQKVLDTLSQHGPSWALEEQFIVWQMMINYLAVHNRLQVEESRTQIKALLDLLLERRYYDVFHLLHRALFLNLVKMALMVVSEKAAQELAQRLSTKLPGAERQLLQAHAQIAIAFKRGRYEAVLKLIYENFPRHTMEAYHDGLRLKSYRLRSALALVPTHEYEEEYERATADFDKFLERKKKGLAVSHYQHYRAFLKNTTRIFKALTKPNSERPHALYQVRQKLQHEVNTHAYNWMIAFIDRMIGEQ